MESTSAWESGRYLAIPLLPLSAPLPGQEFQFPLEPQVLYFSGETPTEETLL